MLVRIFGNVNCTCLDQDRSKYGWAGKFDLSSVEQHRDMPAALESLRAASHGDRPTRRNGEQGGPCAGPIGREYVDDGVKTPESMSPPVGRRWGELIAETHQRGRRFLSGAGQGTDIHHHVNVSARSADREIVFVR